MGQPPHLEQIDPNREDQGIEEFTEQDSSRSPPSWPFPGRRFWKDGKANGRIIWVQQTETSSPIVSANPDGSDFRVLTHPPADQAVDLDPVPSPGGGRILFERDTETDALIGFVRADGSDERILETGCVDPCADDIGPAWTPDGRHVAFTRVVGPFELSAERLGALGRRSGPRT